MRMTTTTMNNTTATTTLPCWPSWTTVNFYLLFWSFVVTVHQQNNIVLVRAAEDDAQPTPSSCANGGEDHEACLDCGLYWAESTLANQGYGLFAGRSYQQSQIVSPSHEIAINLMDFVPSQDIEWNGDNEAVERESMVAFLQRYLWDARYTHSTYDADHVETLIPGLGFLPQLHKDSFNLQLLHTNDARQSHHRNVQHRRHLNSSSGAISPLAPVDFVTSIDIEAGQELFLSPSQRKLLDVDESLWTATRRRTTTIDASADESSLSPQHHRRSMEDLQQYGMCVDHLEVKPSVAVENQNGAFLRRGPIQPGQVVLPIPVVPLVRQHLHIPISSSHGTSIHPFHRRRRQKETQSYSHLVLNYCYGHVDSSLLWLPIAPLVNFINHATNNHQPNVALRWSSHNSNSNWTDLSPIELLQSMRQSSSQDSRESPSSLPWLELYALRELQPGEELLLDCGVVWERAWQHHQHNHRMHHQLDLLLHNHHTKDRSSASSSHLQDDDELMVLQHDDSLQFRCWIDVDTLLNQDVTDNNDEDLYWYDFVPTQSNWIDATTPCEIVAVDTEKDDTTTSNSNATKTYRVVMTIQYSTNDPDDNDDGEGSEQQEMVLRVQNVPRDAIAMVDKPYQGAQYKKRAFRHEIQLPNGTVPEAWRDSASPTTTATEKCGLYMAESAIPNSGFGMYTAQPIAVGDRIFHGDVVVQVEDYDVNNRLRRMYHRQSQKNESTAGWLLNSYYWNPSMTLAHYEADDIQSIVPGLGMLANSHPGLVNAELQAPLQTASLHRDQDVGAGASSNYHDVYFYAPKPIKVGEEIFVKYGDSWFADRTDLGHVPLSSDFVRADALLQKFWHITQRSNSKVSIAHDLWNMVERIINSSPRRNRLAAALPTFDEVATVVEIGSAAHSTPDRVRSLEWLERNGRCLDNLRPGDSTIQQAGKGAFATRAIAQGDVIAPVPVVQIQRNDLEVYETNYAPEEGEEYDYDAARTQTRYLGMQLLLNYCYGHPNSSMLLFPYAPTVNYVNHHSTKANTRIQWSNLPGHRSDWLHKSPAELVRETHAGLVMELVATREIRPGEEVFLDYGTDWDEKWRQFELHWQPQFSDDLNAPSLPTTYIPASLLNERMEWLRTESELEEHPYPFDNVWTACFVGRNRRKYVRDASEEIDDDEEEVDNEFIWTYYKDMYDDTDHLYPCDIVDRDIGDAEDLTEVRNRFDSLHPLDVRYTIRFYDDGEEEHTIFHNVPREAIRFFDTQYSSDLFLRTAFRHDIQLPEEMVSQEWRDLPLPSP